MGDLAAIGPGLPTDPREGSSRFYDPPRTRTWNQLIKSQLLCQIELAGLDYSTLYARSTVMSSKHPQGF